MALKSVEVAIAMLCVSVWHIQPTAADKISENFRLNERKTRLETYIDTGYPVYHMEADLHVRGNIVFTNGVNSLFTTDGRSVTFLANVTTAYTFPGLINFIQLDADHLLIVDVGQSCLWQLDRNTNQISEYLGICGRFLQSVDGWEDEATFSFPSGVVIDVKNPHIIYIAESDGSRDNRIRRVDTTLKQVTTISNQSLSTESINKITQITSSGDFYITDRSSVLQLTSSDLQLSLLTGQRTQGLLDGSFSEAKYNIFDGEILPINRGTQLLLADRFNNRLRLLDLSTRKTTSVCFSHSCDDVRGPRALLVHNGFLYISTDTGIVRVKGKQRRRGRCNRPRSRC